MCRNVHTERYVYGKKAESVCEGFPFKKKTEQKENGNQSKNRTSRDFELKLCKFFKQTWFYILQEETIWYMANSL